MIEAGFIPPPDLPLPQGAVGRGCRRWGRYVNDKGVTLVELLIVIGIIGILAVALGFSYVGWQGAYKVESAVKQFQADLMNARALAMQTNSTYRVEFPTANSYAIKVWNDTNGNGIIDGVELQVLPTFPKTFGYTPVMGIWTDAAPFDGIIQATEVVTTPIAGTFLSFNSRGLISYSWPPVLIDPAAAVIISLTSTNTPDYDCVIISQSRINIGLTTGGACHAK